MTPALEEARRLLRLALRDGDTFALLLPLPKATIAVLSWANTEVEHEQAGEDDD